MSKTYFRPLMKIILKLTFCLYLVIASLNSSNSIGDRYFKFAAPKFWNRLLDTLSAFNKKQLKTYLFRIAYGIAS
jgi:hypothetical protein